MPSSAPPRALAFGVACVAGAMLLFELAVTRLFSVLFFYHFSFFAISLVMSGLVIGGIASARWNVREMSERAYLSRLSALGWMFSAALLAAVALIALIANAAAGGYLLHLASASRDKPLVDRWNDYSRIQVVDGGADGRYIVIDKSAATVMKHVPAEADGGPPLAQAWW